MQKDKNMKLEDYNGYMKFKCFNNQEIPIIGQIQMELRSGSWTAKNCNILVVKHKSQNLMGRDILTKLGLTLNQQQATKGKKIFDISENDIKQNITKWIFKKYPHLCSRLGRSKNHIAKSILKKEKTPTQHKGRRVPLHLVEKVENELQKLIEDNQIIRLEKWPDDLFISPVVIMVKKDKSIKIALDTKELNKAIHKNKYQTQSIDHLTDSLAMKITSNKNKEGPWWFSNIDLEYAYSQIPLDDSIAEHCNFSILGGKATGTYRFINGFYGLTDMPVKT